MVESLDLSELAEGVPALSQSHLVCLAEVACVELGKHKHANPVQMQVRGGNHKIYKLYGFPITDAMRRTYGKRQILYTFRQPDGRCIVG